MNAASCHRPRGDRPPGRREELVAGLGLGLALVLVLGATAARAGQRASLGRCTLEDAQTAEPVTAGPGEYAPAAAAMAAELAHPLPTPGPATERAAARVFLHEGWSPLRFVDHLELGDRIRSLRPLRLLRLWDDSTMTVFVGLNRAGVAGLHVQQQESGEPLRLTRLPASAQLPPLRGIPLDSR